MVIQQLSILARNKPPHEHNLQSIMPNRAKAARLMIAAVAASALASCFSVSSSKFTLETPRLELTYCACLVSCYLPFSLTTMQLTLNLFSFHTNTVMQQCFSVERPVRTDGLPPVLDITQRIEAGNCPSSMKDLTRGMKIVVL